MKCPTIEKWRKQDKLQSMPADKLASHWHKCKVCQKNFEQERKRLNIQKILKQKGGGDEQRNGKK